MSNNWQFVNLEDIQNPKGRAIVSGPFGSNIGMRFFVPEGIPVIRGNNLTTDMRRFVDDGFVFITEEKAKELGNCEALPGDLIFTAAGSLGQVGIIPDKPKYPRYIISNKQLRVRLDPEKVDKLFVFYWLSSPQMVENIQQQNTGSSVPLINLSILRKLPVPLPPLPEQRAIAGMLGALDDKIELNRRMNRTLESMARAVFRQWFVESEEVTGWKVGKFGDVAENIRRSTNAQDIDPEMHYIGLEHMPRGSIALSEWGNASELASNKFIFKEGEFLFGKLRPYFHKVGIAPIDGVCSTDILVIAPKSPEWHGFVLGHISSVELINYTNAASTGTKMPRTNWSDIANYEVAIPPLEKAKEFTEIFLPMAQQIRANIMESRTLARLRESLLPRLMRGEVRVKDV
jgi:type I restriction enzyme S subunit